MSYSESNSVCSIERIKITYRQALCLGTVFKVQTVTLSIAMII